MRGWDFGNELTVNRIYTIHQTPAFADYSMRKKEQNSKRKQKNGKMNDNKIQNLQ